MPVALRIIPCLDVDAGHVVKGMNSENFRDAGGPVGLASRYGTEDADEITFLDASASSQGRAAMLDVVTKTAEEVFASLTVGGEVHSVEGVTRLLAHGADRVGINTVAIADPDLVLRVAGRFGDQVLVLSVDTRRCPEGVTTAFGFEVTIHDGKRSTGINALEWALKATSLGTGETLSNSIDTDGVRTGFGPEILSVFRSEVIAPLIVSGGAGTSEHFLEAARTGADALLAASVFHFGEVAISDVESALHTQGFGIRI